jgi:hypothetical protein
MAKWSALVMPKSPHPLARWAPTPPINFVGLMIAVKWFAMWWLTHVRSIKRPNGTQRHSNLIVSILGQLIVLTVASIQKIGRLVVHQVKQER